jgi:hypothetical protein
VENYYRSLFFADVQIKEYSGVAKKKRLNKNELFFIDIVSDLCGVSSSWQ